MQTGDVTAMTAVPGTGTHLGALSKNSQYCPSGHSIAAHGDLDGSGDPGI